MTEFHVSCDCFGSGGLSPRKMGAPNAVSGGLAIRAFGMRDVDQPLIL
jgi:hypothetical protein